MKETLIQFVKKETVMTIAALLALFSAFVVTPSFAYLEYIDFRVLGLLLSLMIVMAGFQKNGLFDAIGTWLLKRCHTLTTLSFVLVFLCYFFSMFITNDVALITFVPFSISTLRKCKKENMLIPIIVLQTLSANLGSMLTPIGNPQNLYLFNIGGFRLGSFLLIMLPYTLVSGIIIAITCYWVCAKERDTQLKSDTYNTQKNRFHFLKLHALYGILFFICLLVVSKVLPFYLVLGIVLICTLLFDRTVLKQVDYNLIFTFIFFFIFTGNLGKMNMIGHILEQGVTGRELTLGIFTSQFISNVPATLLLSSFTNHYKALLIGVNLGGLGTLIASMASLISYKLYAHNYNKSKGNYFLVFTLANVIMLLLLIFTHIVLTLL